MALDSFRRDFGTINIPQSQRDTIQGNIVSTFQVCVVPPPCKLQPLINFTGRLLLRRPVRLPTCGKARSEEDDDYRLICVSHWRYADDGSHGQPQHDLRRSSRCRLGYWRIIHDSACIHRRDCTPVCSRPTHRYLRDRFPRWRHVRLLDQLRL